MKNLIRSSLFALSSLALIFSTTPAASRHQRPAGIGSSFRGPIGLQLYSLRAQFAKDVPGTMDEVKKLGFHYVELAGTYGLSAEKFKQELDARGLIPISEHVGYEDLRDHLDTVVRDAKTLGLKYVGCAWIPHNGAFDEKTCRQAIQVFNHAGEVLSKNGFRFFYHVHGYEFQPYGQGTLFDLLFKETSPKYVHYEMDVFWIVFPGQDPVKLMEKYPNRWELMHLKDMKKGTKTGLLTANTDVRNDVAIGTGMMDWTAILKEARKIGVKWYFIEDESPTSEEQIPVSLKYLESVKF